MTQRYVPARCSSGVSLYSIFSLLLRFQQAIFPSLTKHLLAVTARMGLALHRSQFIGCGTSIRDYTTASEHYRQIMRFISHHRCWLSFHWQITSLTILLYHSVFRFLIASCLLLKLIFEVHPIVELSAFDAKLLAPICSDCSVFQRRAIEISYGRL